MILRSSRFRAAFFVTIMTGAIAVAPPAVADPPIVRDHRASSSPITVQTPMMTRPGEYAFRFVMSKTYLSASGASLVAGPTVPGPNEKWRVAEGTSATTLEAANGAFVTANRGSSCPNAESCGVLRLATTLGAGDDRGFGITHDNSVAYAGAISFWPKVQLGWQITQTGDWQHPASGVVFRSGSSAMALAYPLKCGDLGAGLSYRVRATGATRDSFVDPVKLLRQPNGTYAFQMKFVNSNDVHYVTAVGGGGFANDKDSPEGATLKFDRRTASTWEQFRVNDLGNCTYTIQTEKSFLVGQKDGSGNALPTFSTRISDPNAAPSIGYHATYEFWSTDL